MCVARVMSSAAHAAKKRSSSGSPGWRHPRLPGRREVDPAQTVLRAPLELGDRSRRRPRTAAARARGRGRRSRRRSRPASGCTSDGPTPASSRASGSGIPLPSEFIRSNGIGWPLRLSWKMIPPATPSRSMSCSQRVRVEVALGLRVPPTPGPVLLRERPHLEERVVLLAPTARRTRRTPRGTAAGSTGRRCRGCGPTWVSAENTMSLWSSAASRRRLPSRLSASCVVPWAPRQGAVRRSH